MANWLPGSWLTSDSGHLGRVWSDLPWSGAWSYIQLILHDVAKIQPSMGGVGGSATKLTIILQRKVERRRSAGESLKQKLRCNNILTILARKMWPGTQKRKVESLTMLNECSQCVRLYVCVCVCVCVCVSKEEGAKDVTHIHIRCFAFAAAKEICSANCSNILALPRTQIHVAPFLSTASVAVSLHGWWTEQQRDGWWVGGWAAV